MGVADGIFTWRPCRCSGGAFARGDRVLRGHVLRTSDEAGARRIEYCSIKEAHTALLCSAPRRALFHGRDAGGTARAGWMAGKEMDGLAVIDPFRRQPSS